MKNTLDKYIMFLENGKITIQEAEYIEDGWYIEIINEEITLFEIPLGGGIERKIGIYKSIIEAIKKTKLLT